MIQLVSWAIIIGIGVIVYVAMTALYVDSLHGYIKKLESGEIPAHKHD